VPQLTMGGKQEIWPKNVAACRMMLVGRNEFSQVVTPGRPSRMCYARIMLSRVRMRTERMCSDDVALSG
jgi:hypothetical protein